MFNTAYALSTPLPFYATQLISSFLNLLISANHDKVKEIQQMGNPYKGDCISIVKSLLELLIIIKGKENVMTLNVTVNTGNNCRGNPKVNLISH